MYLLDTNVCIHLLNRRHLQIEEHFKACSPSDISLCSVVKAELLFGARRSKNIEKNLQLLELFFQPLGSLTFDDSCAEQYGIIREELTSQGKIIGPNDLMIAATAKAHDAVLITNNTKEFSRVSGLRLEDWQS